MTRRFKLRSREICRVHEPSAFLADLNAISEATVNQRRSSQGLVKDHLLLLETSRGTSNAIVDSKGFSDTSSPLLCHPDLNARNIFVDPNELTKIVGTIDWQSAAIEPAFVHALETPDFAEEPLLDRTLDADEPPNSLEAQAHAQRCKTAWAAMVFLSPNLGRASALNPVVGRYLAGVSAGFSDGATSLRTLLIDVSHDWQNLGIPGVCPYQPSHDDESILKMELDRVESTQRLRAYLSRLLRCEENGWVEIGRWDEVVSLYREQYNEFVHACIASREDHETVEDAKKNAEKLWPFDFR